MWTGEEVCAREYSPGHLARVADQLGRKPFLWDNYPVNDGARMSQHLHLRGFTGRPAAIGDHLAAHGINLASQPVLSRIPALTLAESYATGDGYEYGAAFERAARAVLGDDAGRARPPRPAAHSTIGASTGSASAGRRCARATPPSIIRPRARLSPGSTAAGTSRDELVQTQ